DRRAAGIGRRRGRRGGAAAAVRRRAGPRDRAVPARPWRGRRALTELSPEQLLTTTRAVRRRLDLERPVDGAGIRRCVELATPPPTPLNPQHWHFLVVTAPALRPGLAGWYRRAWSDYASSPPDANPPDEAPGAASSRHLARVLDRVPAHVIPCVEGRPEGE